MPATAGRIRMPANNRVHSSAALQTHGIWQSAIGYDPYAPSRPDNGSRSGSDSAYASFQGLLALARLTTGSGASETRGACRKCGRVGHLTYQCRNFLTLKEEKEKENYDPALPLEEMVRKSGGVREESPEESSDSSSSDVDPDIERIIKKRYRWSFSKRVTVDDSDDDDEDEKRRRRRHRRRRREDRSSSSEEVSDEDRKEGRKRKERKRKRREDDESSSSGSGSDEDRKRRKRKKSHRHCKD